MEKHVFADQKSQTGLFIRTVGITLAAMRIGLANIVYNMRRFPLPQENERERIAIHGELSQ